MAAPPRPTTTNHQFNNKNNQNKSQNPHNNVSIQGRPPRSNNTTLRDFTPLVEPIEAMFQKLVLVGVVVFLITLPFDPNQPKPRWYNENEYCEYHRIKGHDTRKCMKLKIYIQDLIDRGEIEIANAKPSNNNDKLKIY